MGHAFLLLPNLATEHHYSFIPHFPLKAADIIIFCWKNCPCLGGITVVFIVIYWGDKI